MPVVCNNVPRPIVDDYELTPKERSEFDYLNWAAIEKGEDSASFFRYKGQLYDLNDFMVVPRNLPESTILKGWHGYISDSFFSGIVVKYCEDDDHVLVGRYY